MDKLPPAQKRRCILYFYHGLSEKEIAKAEGVSQQMVSLSLDGALKKLKKYLKL
ncbi:sigma factor-like helix-turn-helix DNA-binding protein [Butyrivibrio sp. AE3004]|uniref:sigma factor-like helix-turn-helix DNA-binding protein n=1 Tax=Butyrivibrio sp. AE3004 TaxID=1506994 RepID=UPI0009E04224